MKFIRKQKIEEYQEEGRVLMIYGPRRIGKTTMAKKYLEGLGKDVKYKYDVGDDLALRQLFNNQIRKDILDYVMPYDVIVIDEAQNISSIGIATKMIIDEYPKKKIILTGSSSFDLSQSVGEPLVGRHYSMKLLPVSWAEFELSNYEKQQNLEDLLIYGAYPEIVLADDKELKQKKLNELISSYLFKDILSLDKLRSPELLLDLLRALAFQLGNEVSLGKLSKDLGNVDPKKIARYLDVLEKTFVIKKVKAFSRNPRNEISKKSKYYFYDLGVRNAIISRFQGISLRDGKDIGALWENFIFMEFYKKSIISGNLFDNFYFWRNKRGQEIDIIKETTDDGLFAFECKWSLKEVSFSDFKESYPKSITQVISKSNFTEFL
jgi:predicted AAA+ superfamily ATPase